MDLDDAQQCVRKGRSPRNLLLAVVGLLALVGIIGGVIALTVGNSTTQPASPSSTSIRAPQG